MSARSPQADTPSPAAARDAAAAQRVLGLEAQALSALSSSIDGRFSAAVDLLLKVQGRVIVSGMGKSGHVGRKIAATLASTGTPAMFVHPGEASHGDLGMITAQDAALLLSNSGEVRELADLIEYTRRFGVPMAGITSNPQSTLARNSDVALILPKAAEACPMGLAPTTSTTMMLALGDALAVALMERRGFTQDQYRVFHPGGNLGRRLVRVSDIMHAGDEVPIVNRQLPVADVLITMTSKRFGCAGVCDADQNLIGIVTDGDLRRHMSRGLLGLTAADIMTPSPKTIRSSALAAEALRLMNQSERPFTCLFVVADDAVDGQASPPVGILHIHDCLRAGVA
ncbi:MAG TPA: KpsF/GutQ family sugar-phosphate isomerase [Alphaproteobacteria bacterium]|nr:KpsF/GutQ family sugar-phosphate isomerase [Alphaproteobacteria bacterium]HAJ45894.1 KpsF/GutQ family sugar-phosphate isomerase [Alphaproteobacteria bacterium]